MEQEIVGCTCIRVIKMYSRITKNNINIKHGGQKDRNNINELNSHFSPQVITHFKLIYLSANTVWLSSYYAKELKSELVKTVAL